MILRWMPKRFAICRWDPDASIPHWARNQPFYSMTRTPNEFSIVCDVSGVPSEFPADRGWRALEVAGPMDLSTVGVLASLLTPLAQAGIAIFAISTFDTDYILVKESAAESAENALRMAGHEVGV